MPNQDILRVWQEYIDGIDLRPMLESTFRTIYQQDGNFIGFVDQINLERVAPTGLIREQNNEDLTLRDD
jgi:hypothetical protein